jgi:hypothetical protein
MHSDVYDFLTFDRIDTMRRDAQAGAAAARLGPTQRRPRFTSRHPALVAAVALALGGFLGSATTLVAVDAGPAAATAPTGEPIRTSTVDRAPGFPGDDWDDPGYGDGYGSGRRVFDR